MIEWIIGVVIYILIGIGLLIYAVTSDPWGGLLLEVWWLVVFFYPLLMVWSAYQKFRR